MVSYPNRTKNLEWYLPEALRKATRDGDKFVGEELIFRLGFDAIIGLVLFALYFPEKI